MVTDTVVECRKCGRRQHLEFVNGLKNGWSKCCGKTMPIIQCVANIDEAVEELVKKSKNLFPHPNWDKEKQMVKEEPWSVS